MPVDTDKLREEINKKKSQQDQIRGQLGENKNIPIKGDVFLAQLKEAAQSGRENGATIKIKAVDRVAEAKKKGESVDASLLEHIDSTPQKPKAPNANVNQQKTPPPAPKLEFYGEPNTNVKGNSTLADSINQYKGASFVGQNNPNPNNGYLNEQQMREKMMTNAGVDSNQQQPSIINEQVNNKIQEILNENFGHYFGEAMKQTIVETYQAERVAKALKENKDMIKDIVVEVILELQKKGQTSKK